ncbi:MAG: endospore germination permease [Bacillota bacterium]|nr:endospore germination permease [Bacillota bacterium]
MIEKGKISSLQMAIMMNPTIIATVLLLVPAITAKHAKQDMWLSPIWASLIGFFAVFLAYKLNKLYPQYTLIEYCEPILGKVLGKIVGALYLFFYLHLSGMVVREYGEFVSGTFLPHTPILFVFGTMLLVCSFAVYGGLEVIGRCSEIIVPVVLLLYLVIFIMLIKDFHIRNMFPLMENGITPSIVGSIVPQCWFSEYILVAFFFPYLTDQQKGLKWGMISVTSVLFLMVLTQFTSLFLFGRLTSVLTYPVMVAARYISLAEFMEHLEAIVMAIWVAGTFIKITVLYYVLALGTAQWLKLSDFRPIVFPIGFLLLIFGVWAAPNLDELSHFISTSAPFYLFSIQIFVPLILLLIALVRKRKQPNKETATG